VGHAFGVAGRVTWNIDHIIGTAADVHGRAWPDPLVRTLWLAEVTRPAIALGSAQRRELIDGPAALAAGVDVVTRRSGGGAVWLAPGAQVWADVFIGRDDPLWVDDVGTSMDWLGAVWVEALSSLGLDGLTVHRGALVRNEWSSVVCFAGLGPGEVTWHGAKVVGISQRRTRTGARFQCSALLAWEPAAMLQLLAPNDLLPQSVDELLPAARALPLDVAAVVGALLSALGIATQPS
jgi:lipoate---protein ligase